ncbi:MAG: hypothetical protein ACLFN8_00955 [Candidatus Woesearchaeota archaeon]
MAEIKVTYETLFDLLRREKGRGDLQQLDAEFYEDVKEYIAEKKKSLQITTSRGEREKTNIQLKNVKKILRELYELREKKIISIASSKVKTQSNLIDTSKLLTSEKKLFEDACELFQKYKEEILENITNDEQTRNYYSDEKQEYTPETKTTTENKHTHEKQEDKRSVNETQKNIEKQDMTKEQIINENEITNIKILNDLPRFLGVDKKIYGPYKKGDETQMPYGTAKLLLDKKRAQKI